MAFLIYHERQPDGTLAKTLPDTDARKLKYALSHIDRLDAASKARLSHVRAVYLALPSKADTLTILDGNVPTAGLETLTQAELLDERYK